ncbi:response regulator transcription factor [Streptomyces sp. 7N604]|uniref:response regulator transcription factor n=1 Tax=Streptomyces sp. 7N604 TaxID=3457415 RepID=UPI003FD32841
MRPADIPSAHVLIAEDEAHIASFVEKGLRSHGFLTTVVTTGAGARRGAMSGKFDLLILDLGLPDEDGFTVLSRLRAVSCPLPVIILTARNGVVDTVKGLEGGANDYMAKPFRFEELLARVRLRLQDGDGSALCRAGVVLDSRTRQARVDGRIVDLSPREFALLEVMMRGAGRVLPREQLLSTVWGYDADEASNVVDVYVRYLRRKLGTARITTVRGRGYRLEMPDAT